MHVLQYGASLTDEAACCCWLVLSRTFDSDPLGLTGRTDMSVLEDPNAAPTYVHGFQFFMLCIYHHECSTFPPLQHSTFLCMLQFSNAHRALRYACLYSEALTVITNAHLCAHTVHEQSVAQYASMLPVRVGTKVQTASTL